MRSIVAIIAVALLLAAPAVALAQDELVGQLSHEAEVPAPDVPSDYAGTGSATVTISADGSSIDYDVDFEGLTGPLTMAHIHWGAAGNAGPPIFWLTEQDVPGSTSPLTGTLDEADFTGPVPGGPQTYEEALAAMRAGNTYVNLHTERNGAGELRAQLTAAAPDATPPDTAMTTEPGASGGLPWPALIALLGLVALTLAARRFLGRLA